MTLPSASGTYGRRSVQSLSQLGIRQPAPTYGKSRHACFSVKAGGSLQVESSAEAVVAHLLSIDPEVRRFMPQPLSVELQEGRLLRSPEELAEARRAIRAEAAGGSALLYTPDFLVEWQVGDGSFIEVKREGFEGEVDYQRKLERVRDVLQGHGYSLRLLVVPQNGRGPLTYNIRLLSQALLDPPLHPTERELAVIEQICGLQPVRAAELFQSGEIDASRIASLLLQGALGADLAKQRLDRDLWVHAAHGDLDHLQFTRRLSS